MIAFRAAVYLLILKVLSHQRDAIRNDACFSWCNEATRLSFHTARDRTVISTLSDLYVCSQVRNMSYMSSYASDNCRDGFNAFSNAAVWKNQWNV